MLDRIPLGLIALEVGWLSCLAFAAYTIVRAVDVQRMCYSATLVCSTFGVG